MFTYLKPLKFNIYLRTYIAVGMLIIKIYM